MLTTTARHATPAAQHGLRSDSIASCAFPRESSTFPYLLELLVDQQYDLKAVMYEIMTSRTYQLSSVPTQSNYDDLQCYSRFHEKRLSAEVLLDAVNAACGTSESFVGMQPGTKAISLWDNRLPSYFLEVFGRPERTSPCECIRSSQPTMAQALHLMNAPEIEEKLTSPEGRIASLIERNAPAAEIIK